jgi:spore maturation protein CgeB
MIYEYLDCRKIRKHDIFNSLMVQRAVARFLNGEYTHGCIWALLFFRCGRSDTGYLSENISAMNSEKSLKILVVGLFVADWHEKAWIRALQEMGHTVGFFELSKEFVTPWERMQYRLKSGFKVNLVNNQLLHIVKQFRPHIVLCYRALIIFPSTIDEIRHRDACILVCYNNDNPFSSQARWRTWRHFRSAIPHYHLHLVYRHSDIYEYTKAGAKQVYMLRSHYLPWLHRRLQLNAEERRTWDADICFLGHCSLDDRLTQLSTLMHSVPGKYNIRGSNWAKFANGYPWKGLDTQKIQGEDYVKALNASRIGLCFLSQRQSEDTYTRRCFEIPACGTMMLSQRTADLVTLYEEDSEAVFFGCAEELVDKAGFYLQNEDARQRVAEAGWRRCTISGYDIYSRMKEWLNVARELL